MVIGIDQSYTSTGIVALDDVGAMVYCLAIESTAGMNLAGLRYMADKVGKQVKSLAERRYSASGAVLVAIEGNSVASSNSKTARALAELSGAIKFALSPIEVLEVHISSWKSKIAMNRLRGVKKRTKAGTAEYLAVIADVTGHTFGTTDEADAYCIAEYARRYYTSV
jgi:hypothetical protein